MSDLGICCSEQHPLTQLPSAQPLLPLSCALPFTLLTCYSKELTTSTAFLVGDPLICLRVEGLDITRENIRGFVWREVLLKLKGDFSFPVYA